MEQNKFTGTYVSNYSNLNQQELIALISKELNISEEDLSKEINNQRKELFKKELTYWQIYVIAKDYKYNSERQSKS